jgi:uncharacterized protein (DUF952 family)
MLPVGFTQSVWIEPAKYRGARRREIQTRPDKRRTCSAGVARQSIGAAPSGNVTIFTGRCRLTTIYKICEEKVWRDAERDGAFFGSAVDYADGFIHFSSAAQVAATAGRHFTGMSGLVLVAVDAEALGPALKWEPSRGGALFPHLYGPLQLAAVRWVKPLRLDPDGRHVFPKLEE